MFFLLSQEINSIYDLTAFGFLFFLIVMVLKFIGRLVEKRYNEDSGKIEQSVKKLEEVKKQVDEISGTNNFAVKRLESNRYHFAKEVTCIRQDLSDIDKKVSSLEAKFDTIVNKLELIADRIVAATDSIKQK